ncbi:MAG: lysozyme [Candidatus Cloacimonadota bacterium]
MTEALMNRIKAQLVRHEGLRLKPYRCTAGKLTIVVMNGFPIRSGMTDDCGISQKEAYAMLERDIRDCEQWLIDEIPEIYNKLDEVRQSVLLNMCFNLGIKGLLGFKNTLTFISAGD